MTEEMMRHNIMDKVLDLLCHSNINIRFEGYGDSDRIFLLDENEGTKLAIVEDGKRIVISSEHEYINMNFPLNPTFRAVKIQGGLSDTVDMVLGSLLHEISMLKGRNEKMNLNDIEHSDNIIVYIGDRYSIRDGKFLYSLFVGEVV